ncbi:hypothetical protein DAETH_48070 (plasmid) [Deinococcus aetherius]|uniref:Uncharacterized protein n=1 Tax=Deinococcus aetherius TaxID=200252 RepID=A0ABM8ALW6_9DEIO|nr:hypothetical protein [Deinococcus aetherius]BDP44838.1 hypothetical protein DAETH_48070 [Deinococcus aetherius]
MELDPETKVRIEAEEAYRAEVRRSQPPSVDKRRQNFILLGVLAVLALLYGLSHASWLVTLTPAPTQQHAP